MTEPTANPPAPAINPDGLQRTLKVAFDLHQAGRQEDAEALCRLLLPHQPEDSQLRLLLGMVLQQLGRGPEALKQLELAAQLQPKSARIWNSLGFIHQSLQQPTRALECYVQAINLGWNAADTYYSMGNACYQLGDVEQAAAMFRKAVELKPRDIASWSNLGKCLNECNRLQESIRAYEQALAIDPQWAQAGYGRAISQLAAGQLAEGFRGYNQWRTNGLKQRQFSQPVWQGERIPDATLLLHAEQGFGDAIQHARFVPQVRERAGRVILECRPELKTLFTHCGCADVVIAHGEPIPPFDFFSSLPSLPGILGVDLATIPSQVPYLKVPLTGQLPPPPAGRLKVGLVWAGNPSHHNDAVRSIRLEHWGPILRVPEIRFYSLQAAVPPQDETHFRSLSQLLDLSGRLENFLVTATMVAELDLIITVDSAVAHLAGALGKPVWTLLPFAPDWRWLMAREDTPWYPTMRLFRQKQRGQWPPVIACVAEELGRLATRKTTLSRIPVV